MGVPKFFRYISERYPCLSELVKEYEIPEFDNLYLDMNGIIHMCTHPDDFDPHFRMSEEKMFSHIFHYIEVLFQMIKPCKIFFMAVDGVAPRAKMNQQRGRRFRSAKEAEDLEAKARASGETLPEEARFDSNCITPGTVFMDRLQQQLKYFVQNKISNDKLWQKCKIILSGHETPGEGEHKIMDYIRYIKSQPGYDPNTRHCLYGLDADLIMLGLCSHEPHFSLLREEVRFGKKVKRKNVPEQINFYLLHLSLMREYLELEFLSLKDSLPFDYDREKIIDDWVLMGFLVGNDFIPHLPNLHIASGALSILYNAYMKILPTLDGYINEGGHLNLSRFEKFMNALAAIEIDNFSENYADLKYFEAKTGRRPNNKERTSYKNRVLVEWDDDDDSTDKPTDPALAALLKSTDYLLEPDKKTSWNIEPKNVSELKFKDSKNSKEGPVIDTANMFAALNIDDGNTENKKENSTEKLLVDTSIKEAVKEIKAEENCSNKDEILIDLSENTVEPSQNNLKDMALEEGELEDDEDLVGSPYYSDEYETDEDEDELRAAEFLQHKNDYYMNKLDYSQVTPEVLRSQAEGYVRAIQWNLNYYYNGCCSWSWYYPHHYAPYISDIKDFSNLQLKYDMGKPFQPFEQLLAVLPSASKGLLPEPYHYLMTSDESPVIEYYPHDFKTDLNGKKQEWEAVVLIPFIAENLLLDAMGPCNEKLSQDEVRRNTHGPMLIYEYTKECQGTVEAPEYFPPIRNSYAKLTPVTMELIRVPREKLIKGPCPGAITDTYYPGFPTFKHLKYDAHLEKAKVKVFDQPSQNENMIITIKHKEEEVDLQKLAKQLIGKSVYVGWPHLTEALVVGVSNSECKIQNVKETSKSGEYITELNKGKLASLWHTMSNATTDFHKTRLGIEVGDADILVHVKGFSGQKYVFTSTGSISVEKQWNVVESVYSYDAVITHLDVSISDTYTLKNIQELFPLGSTVFMLGNPHYGAKGEVIDNTSLKSGRIKVNMCAMLEPDFGGLYKLQQELKYMPAGEASRRLAITPHLLSRITGSIFIVPADKADKNDGRGKINIGLNLKLNKKNRETPGYTRKVEGTWLYSPKAINLVNDYMEAYSKLFTFISKNMGNDVYNEKDIFPEESGRKGKIKEITEWLKKQPFSSVEHQTVGTLNVDPEIVKKIEEIVDEFKEHNSTGKQVVMQVKPHLLYKPEVQTGLLPPDVSAAYNLYDRVVNVRQSYTVPYGLKGTVIGIHTENKNDIKNGIEVMYDVVFDETFTGGLQLNCTSGRGYRCPKPALINISHGMRVVQQKTVNPATNNPYYAPKVPPPRLQQGFNQFPMRGQNSAFVNCNPNRGPQGYGHPPQRPMFQPPFMNRDGPFRGQFGGPQQPPLRPPGMQQRPPQPQGGAAGAEFRAFFQDLQRNQNKPNNNYGHSHNNYQRNNNQQHQQQFNQQQNFSTQSTSQSSTTQAVNDETEALKKLLKISEKQNSEPPQNNKPPAASDIKSTQPISVQDFFAHARNQEQKVKSTQGENSTPYYCVQLLNYCQANGKGIPRYNFLNVPDGKFRTQIVLTDGRASIGDEATTKQEASELAAKKMLNDIVKQGQNHGQNLGNAMKPSGFPSPPKQWCQNDSNSPRSQQNAQHSNMKPVKVLSPHKKNDQSSQNAKSTFVPLQAVKQHRQRTASHTNEENKPHNPNKNDNAGNSNKSNSNDTKQQHHKNESSSKPKQRKSRIAANFSAAPKK